jgi:hypothetical protein
MQGTADLHHHIADALLPEADPIFHNATALHATVDMLDGVRLFCNDTVDPGFLFLY